MNVIPFSPRPRHQDAPSSNVREISLSARTVVSFPARPNRRPEPDLETADPEAIDRASQIIQAAVTYAANEAAHEGAFRADHTGNLLFAGESFEELHGRRRDRALGRLVRLLTKAKTPRWSEIWAAVSVGEIIVGKMQSYCGYNIDDDDLALLKAVLAVVARDCERRRAEEG